LGVDFAEDASESEADLTCRDSCTNFVYEGMVPVEKCSLNPSSKMMTTRFIPILLACVSFCTGSVVFGESRVLRLATTTSVEHSGLLPYLLPEFEKKNGIKVHVIAVGTGKALKLGENGDVDALLVHAPDVEREFMSKGFGKKREEIMFNHFLIAGPMSDPAGLKNCKSAETVMKRLADGLATFISRGDESGTHKKEQALWKSAATKPDGDWYLEVGRGMGPALLMASEKGAYVLSDRGTFLSMKKKLNLSVCFEGGDSLLNIYSVITVNPMRHPRIRNALAKKFIQWMVSTEAQKDIGSFIVEGEPLFRPLRQKESK